MFDTDVHVKRPCRVCAGLPPSEVGGALCSTCAGSGEEAIRPGIELPCYLAGASDPYRLLVRLGEEATVEGQEAECARRRGDAWQAGFHEGRRVGLLAARFALDHVLRQAATVQRVRRVAH